MATNEALRVDVAGNDDLSRIYPHKALCAVIQLTGALFAIPPVPLKWLSIPVRSIA